ncbi:unnamed protein product [Orchesella dallaii]|uniref:Uncharacterized protein n=1 Tax=Orchesella dallaii TaxID=48710 RepID=A0ABP1RAL1_9HEXA
MRVTFILILTSFLSVIGLSGIAECSLPFGIFPFLTTGWYYKPSPVESVVLGLIVVKVLVLRLASITGILPIPYHLNDIFLRSLGKRSIPEPLIVKNLTLPHQWNLASSKSSSVTTELSENELAAIYRVFLGLRRIDTNDCFLKMLCFISRRYMSGFGSLEDKQMIETIRYISAMEKASKKDPYEKSPIMDVYEKALRIGISGNNSSLSCTTEYLMCSLSERAMSFETIISELF